MSENLNASQEEAIIVARLVNAWTNAQGVVDALRPLMVEFGLLKPSGALDADRVLQIHARARGG